MQTSNQEAQESAEDDAAGQGGGVTAPPPPPKLKRCIHAKLPIEASPLACSKFMEPLHPPGQPRTPGAAPARCALGRSKQG